MEIEFIPGCSVRGKPSSYVAVGHLGKESILCYVGITRDSMKI